MSGAPYLRSVDALTGTISGEAVSFCSEVVASSLPQRMREAADTIEEVSAKYGYKEPQHAEWSADALRGESRTLDEGAL